MDVLQLDVSGRPQAWLSVKDAAVLYALTHGLSAEDVGELLDSMDEDALL